MQKRNVLAGPYLERDAHARSNPEWFAAALGDERSRVVALWNMRNLVRRDGAPRAHFLRLGELPSLSDDHHELILLGRTGDTHYFAYEAEATEAPRLGDMASFEELRNIAGQLPVEEAGLLAYARGLIYWRKRHRYCGTCGAVNSPARGGHALICTNPTCRTEEFPRLDPAVIVLVTDGERALLGRQSSWPERRYSTIAGFVEQGESLEDAVAREVLEETGVAVDDVVYNSSQPWPFPASLMLGFHARAVTTNIELRDQELEDARWVTRADIAEQAILLPPSLSISYRLIEEWYDVDARTPLRELSPHPPPRP